MLQSHNYREFQKIYLKKVQWISTKTGPASGSLPLMESGHIVKHNSLGYQAYAT
jgi:hypothetical protein